MTYSPLFIRNYAKRFDLRVTAKGLKKRSKARFEAQRQALIMAAVNEKVVLSGTQSGFANVIKLAGKAEEQPWRDNLNMSVMCKDCKENPPNIVEEYSSGDMVCGSCGLILGDRVVDTRSEWRTFSNDDQNNDDPSRVGDGANPLLNGSQLQTSISFEHGNARSRDLYRTQNKQNQDKATKSLLAAYKEIGAMCDAWHIPRNVSDTAKHLFKMVSDAGAFRGKSQEAIIAGCIFIACRQCKVPRTFREIFALTKVSKKEIGRIFKALEKFFSESNRDKNDAVEKAGGVPNTQDQYSATSSTKARELCIRFCSQLSLTHKVTSISEELADKMSSIGALAGRSPLSAAAACIYFASHLMKEPKTAKEISLVAGVSDGTIRTAYKLLEAEKDMLVNPDWLKDGKGDMGLLPKV